ncbi:hypothetical protein SAMN05444144_10833 [Flavobacterium akiainvivens]|nr:hypothetical protein SAMN05444144_10833 [Flavobacterium akiainvivens]
MSVGDVYGDILYDINLKEKKANELTYPNILFIDGKPFLETPEARDLYDKGILKPYKP